MRAVWLSLLMLWAVGCGGDDRKFAGDADADADADTDADADADADADTDADADADTDMPGNLNGEAIDPPLDPVAFHALNMDDSARSLSDLTDGPTLMWFYPLAGSYG